MTTYSSNFFFFVHSYNQKTRKRYVAQQYISIMSFYLSYLTYLINFNDFSFKLINIHLLMERAWAKNIKTKIIRYSKEKIWFLTKKWQTIWRENVTKNLRQYNKTRKQINRKNYVYNAKTNNAKILAVLSDKIILQSVLTSNINNAFTIVYLHLKSFLKDVKLMFISEYKPFWKKIWFLHRVTSAV